MTSHIRVLTESDLLPSLAELRIVLSPDVEIEVKAGGESDWSQLELRHTGGAAIAMIRREPAEEEREALLAGINGARPERGAEWLKHYFSHVKVIYAMQPLGGAGLQNEWSAVLPAQAYFWKKFGGILQADNEGYSNREGYHVLWQFSGPQQGELEAAVMNDEGQWTGFVMDMGDPMQVAAFQRGEVPVGVMRHA